MTVRRIYELTRHCTLPDDGRRTLFFKASGGTRRRPSPFLKPEHVPEFNGDKAWFRCERDLVGVWRAIERVDEHGRPYVENYDAAICR